MSPIDVLRKHLAERTVAYPQRGGWIADVASGHFPSVPRDLRWASSAEVAHLIDGYELAAEVGLGDLQRFANGQRDDAVRHGWRGDLVKLWLSLFSEHRRARHGGYPPEGEELRLLDALCASFTRACQNVEDEVPMSDGLSYLSEDWTSECTNLLEHWVWEPQHLNHNKNVPKELRLPPAEVVRRVMGQEVPLNHLLNIFFRLAPAALAERWFKTVLTRTALEAPILRHTRGHPALSLCQPDMMFEAKRSRLFVELKIKAAATVDQLCTYAAFTAWLDQNIKPQPVGIVFIGPRASAFKEVESFRVSSDFRLPDKLVKKLAPLNLEQDRVLDTLSRMEVAITTYAELDDRLALEKERLGEGEGDETLSKLISGTRQFLQSVKG